MRHTTHLSAGRPRRRWARTATLLAASALGLALPATADAWTIQRTSASKLYIDQAATNGYLFGAYAMYVLTNDTGTGVRDAWVRADTFTGGTATLAPEENGLVHVGALPAGESRTVSLFLGAKTPTTAAQGHTVRLFSGKPGFGGTELAAQPFTLTVETNNFNNANKVDTITASTTSPTLGGLVTLTVKGSTGTIGAAKVMSFSPAGKDAFPARSLRLVHSAITLQQAGCPAAGNNCSTYVDQLDIPGSSLSSTANTPYTAVYTFRAADVTTTQTRLSPVGFISAGQAPAHTSTANFDALGAIEPVENRLTLGLTADRVAVGTSVADRTVTYTATVTNTSTDPVTFDDLVDTLPAGATVVSGSATYAGQPAADPDVTDGVATFAAPFDVPASGTAALRFRVLLPADEGIKVNRIVAHSGETQIDTTLGTTDAPAEAKVAVDATAPTTLITSGPANGTTAATGRFAFHADDAETALAPSTFECRLDDAAWAPCASPHDVTGIGIGPHRLTVRATDAAGNTGPDAPYDWTVAPAPPDVAAPRITVDAPADGAVLRLRQDVRADYACVDVDDRSAVTQCEGPVPNGAAVDTAAPGPHAFTVRTKDAAGNADEMTVHYTVQAPPAPKDLTSDGVAPAPQATTVQVPDGATLDLVAPGGAPTARVEVAGGVYVLDRPTHTITFTPEHGYAGDPAGARFRLTDDLDQVGEATYRPHVALPPLPVASDQAATGPADAVLERRLAVPAGGSVTLLDAAGRPTTVVEIPGQGTYALDVATGRISFVAAAGFRGTARAVTYRITDAYGQGVEATFTATVTRADVPAAAPVLETPGAPAPPAPSAPAPARREVAVTAGVRSIATDTVGATCTSVGTTVDRCAVVLTADVQRRAVVVGRATASGRGRTKVRVAVPLTGLGRALAARPGGALVHVTATVRGTDGSRRVARTRTRVLAKRFAVPRPVLFSTASAALRPGERRYLDGLAGRLRGVRTIRCVGYTDARSSAAYNAQLGLARAAAVCDRLGRLLHVRVTRATQVSRGERGPRASNATEHGRQLNRRTEIHVSY